MKVYESKEVDGVQQEFLLCIEVASACFRGVEKMPIGKDASVLKRCLYSVHRIEGDRSSCRKNGSRRQVVRWASESSLATCSVVTESDKESTKCGGRHGILCSRHSSLSS